jgi:hypothetical protein
MAMVKCIAATQAACLLFPEPARRMRGVAETGRQNPIGTLAEMLRPAAAVHVQTADAAPSCARAYVLVLELNEPLCCVIGGESRAL